MNSPTFKGQGLQLLKLGRAKLADIEVFTAMDFALHELVEERALAEHGRRENQISSRVRS